MFGRKNSKRYGLVFFITFSLIFSPLSFKFFSQSFFVEGEEVPVENIVGNVTWSENRVVSGIVTVESGATLIISKGVVIEFDGKSTIDVLGKLSLEGTPEQPVILKKKDVDVGDTYTVSATSPGVISVRNAIVSGGGSVGEVFMVMRPSLFQRASAFWVYTGALSASEGGRLDVEGVSFHDNTLAVYTDASSYFKTKVWRSRFANNSLDVVNLSVNGKADVRYNWWSNQNGPALCSTECQDRPRTYEKIVGGVNFSDWAKTEYFRDPVIVIPGIMGSWKWTNSSDLVLDPIAGTYDELLETFEENGYTTDVNMFPFPYQWRASNVETAKLLRTKIEAVKTTAKWPKVDIVAHSMGGLVVREYVGTLNGSSNIDQLVTLGTPHDGSPQSYLAWEAGEFYDALFFRELFIRKIFEQEAEENGYESVFDYVRRVPIASVRELLPVSAYLRDKDTSEMRTYPSLYPKNAFLENLKSTSNLNKLTPILFSNIVGRLEREETITKLRVEGASIELLNNPENIVLWGHGKPDGHDNFTGDRGLELGAGDGTVPLESAKSISSDETVELESNHGNLPTDGAKMVVKILTGLDALLNEAPVYPASSMLLFMPFSPIDIQIVSPSGKRVGKDFEAGGFVNEIDGAYYTGSDTENEFVTIPRPEKGEYRILRQGTGNGEYRVEAVYLEEQADGETRESVATVMGVAVTGVEEESSIELRETGEVVAGNQDTTAPVTESSLQGVLGINNWHTSDVAVALVATDEENGSGVEKIEYSLDGEATWNVYSEPFVVTEEGTTTLQYRSTDKEGNQEETKAETIQIDKTAPEGKVVFDSTTQKITVTGKDNLGGTVSVVMLERSRDMVASNAKLQHIRPWFEKWWKKNRKNLPDMLATLTDEAGHTTSIAFEKKAQHGGNLFVRVKSVAYDNGSEYMGGSTSQYDWRMNHTNKYQYLAARLEAGIFTLESRYMPQQEETWVRERLVGRRLDFHEKEREKEDADHKNWLKLPGLIIPYFETVQGKIEAKY